MRLAEAELAATSLEEITALVEGKSPTLADDQKNEVSTQVTKSPSPHLVSSAPTEPPTTSIPSQKSTSVSQRKDTHSVR